MSNLRKEIPRKIKSLSNLAAKELQTLLVQNGFALQIDGIVGDKTLNAFKAFKARHQLTYPEDIGPMTLDVLVKNATPANSTLITQPQLQQIFRSTPSSTIAKFIKPLNDTCYKFKINNRARICAFLAQVGHESGGFKYMEELATGRAYEGRRDLGNVRAGDGMRFKGRGCIQITGRHNYTQISKALNVNFVANPRLLAQLPYAILSAGWYWDSRALNLIADQNTLTAFRTITRKINGGYNGMNDRLSYWNLAKNVLSGRSL